MKSRLTASSCEYGPCLIDTSDPGLLGGIEGRRKRPEYARLLSDCHQIYCEMRMLVMGPIVRERVAVHAEATLTSLMRTGCSYLLQVPLRPMYLYLNP